MTNRRRFGIEGFRIRARQEFDAHLGEPECERSPRDGSRSSGASIKSAVMTVLSNADLHAHNSFDQPNALTPQVKDLQSTGRVLTLQIPPASVTKLELSLM